MLVALIGIPFLLPRQVFPLEASLVVTPLEVGLLIAVILVDPGRIDRRSALLRVLSIALTGLLAIVAVLATALLVVELVNGAPNLRSASALLTTGALVWIDTHLTFSLLYWELDSGGAAARLHNVRTRPDLAFPQHMNPALAPPGWRPVFVDYLYLGFTNATAFSPTDAMPLTHWVKLAMTVQALISILLLSLVIANAVNILG